MKTVRLPADDAGRGRELLELLALDATPAFSRAVLAWIDRDHTLVYSVVRRGTGLVGGRRPDTWTDQDTYQQARISLYEVIDGLRTGQGTADLRPGVGAYLVQWAAPKLGRAMEADLPAGLTAAYRRRTKLHAAQVRLTAATGSPATLEQAAEFANRSGSIARGLRPAAVQGALARVSDLPAHRSEAAGDRARIAADMLAGTDPARLTDTRRVELVVDYNRLIVHKYGFDDALAGQMLARVTDLLPPGEDTDRRLAAEADAMVAELADRAATDPELAADPGLLVETHNRATITELGRRALQESGSVVTARDATTTAVHPMDMAAAADYLRPYPPTSAVHQMVAPGENSMVIAALLTEAGKAHPGLEHLVFEMLDAYRAGEDIRPTRELSRRLGMSVTCLGRSIEAVRQTMREILVDFL